MLMDGWMNEQLIDRWAYSSRRQIREGGTHNPIFPLKSIGSNENKTHEKGVAGSIATVKET